MCIVQDEDSDSGQKEQVELSDSFESDISDIEVSNFQCEINLHRSSRRKINYNLYSLHLIRI
jgi:hypothetical protein